MFPYLFSHKPVVTRTLHQVTVPDSIQMINGGTPFHHKVLANSGCGDAACSPLHTPNTALVKLNTPYNATLVLDNPFRRLFNVWVIWRSWGVEKAGIRYSLQIHCKFCRTRMWFCKPSCWSSVIPYPCRYGFLNAFQSKPQLTNQVYRLYIATSAIRVVACGFDECNRITFDVSGKIVYV